MADGPILPPPAGAAVRAPVFLFSAGWRSGSTLLQRMITASGEVLIWGESGGALEMFANAMECYAQMLGPGEKRYKFGFGGNGALQYEELRASGPEGVHKWVACVTPPEVTFDHAFRDFFDAVYGRPAADLGYPNWGVKSVICGIDSARFLRRIYPAAKFLFLVRNPVDCLTSIKRRNWMDHPRDVDPLSHFAGRWRRLAEEFRTADFGYSVRYEDLVASPEHLSPLAEYLEIGSIPRDFTRTSRVDWAPANDKPLTFVERWRLLKIVGDEMREYGYT